MATSKIPIELRDIVGFRLLLVGSSARYRSRVYQLQDSLGQKQAVDMSGATDRTPLLADRPTSRSTSYDTIASEDGQDKALEYNIDISKKDFIWMLTGLWSM